MHRDAAAFPDLAGSTDFPASKTPQIERFSTAGPQKTLCSPAALLRYGKKLPTTTQKSQIRTLYVPLEIWYNGKH